MSKKPEKRGPVLKEETSSTEVHVESKLRAAEEQIRLLKTELGAAVSRQETSDLEKAKMESELEAAMKKNQSLKTELGAAVSRQETSQMEKARMESALLTAMEKIEPLKAELKAAVTREETANMEKARMESKLHAAMEQIQSLEIELGAAISRYETAHLEKARMELNLQTAMEQIQFLKIELKASTSRQVTLDMGQIHDIIETSGFSEQVGKNMHNGNPSTQTEIPKMNNIEEHLCKEIEKVHKLEMLLSEREKIIIDLKKELANYQIQKDYMLQRDSIINYLEKQIDVQRELKANYRNKDAANIEKRGCRIRMLTNLLQSKNRRAAEQSQSRTDLP
jgi:uncharacterized protein (DUF3084 family)